MGRPENAPRSSHRASPGGAGGRGGRVVASSSLIGQHEVTAPDTPETIPRFERFTVTYPSGTVDGEKRTGLSVTAWEVTPLGRIGRKRPRPQQAEAYGSAAAFDDPLTF